MVGCSKRTGEFVVGGWDPSGSGAMHAFRPYGVGPGRRLLCPVFGVQSVTHLTRLETRTKEFKVYASH